MDGHGLSEPSDIKIASHISEPTNDRDDKSTPEQERNPSVDQKSDLKPSTSKGASNNGGPFLSKADEGFYKHFLNPGLDELEKAVAKQTAYLDEINKKLEDERKAKKKEELSKHIPGPLKGKGQTLDDITKKLNDLIEYENYDDVADHEPNFVKARLRSLGDHENTSLLAHSLAAYLSTLEPSHARNVANKIMSDLSLWLSRLFRFDDALAVFHNEEKDGLVRLCRLALHQNYPKYASDGFLALYTRPPVIYLSAASPPGLSKYLCLQLGLSETCVSVVPCNTLFGSQHKIDISTFERLVSEDMEAQKVPLLLVAYAGTPAIGHVDNLQRLGQICKKNNLWLHVEGNHLATLALYSVPTSVQPAKTGDSITLNLTAWLGIPGIPFITLYKSSADHEMLSVVGLSSNSINTKLSCLPVWVSLQDIGHDGVVSRIKSSMDLAKQVSDKLKKLPTITQLNLTSTNKQEKTTTEIKSFGELFSKAISALLIFEIANPIIVFKFGQNKESPGKTVAPYAANTDEHNDDVEDIDKEYYDALNIWLAETLKRESPRVHLQTLQLDNDGVAIRFAPMETAQIMGITSEDVQEFLESLDEQLEILSATVNQRQNFRDIVLAQDNLRLIEMSHWAGLGVVQYVPNEWLDQINSLPSEGVRDVNTLNAEMVHQLKNNDTAFSLGGTDEGLNCVRFGLITDDTDIEELIGLVYTTGKEVEESSKFLEKMAENVKKGIEAANRDLEKENEDKLLQEGMLRQVPLVGSLLSWWSPPPKEAGIKGRTFNLSSGTVKSTEETYKYHMQIQESSDEPKQEFKPFKASLKSPVQRCPSSNGQINSSISSGDVSSVEHETSKETEVTDQSKDSVSFQSIEEQADPSEESDNSKNAGEILENLRNADSSKMENDKHQTESVAT